LYTSNLKQFLFPPSGKEKGDFNAISMSLTGHISHEAVGAKIYKLFFQFYYLLKMSSQTSMDICKTIQ